MTSQGQLGRYRRLSTPNFDVETDEPCRNGCLSIAMVAVRSRNSKIDYACAGVGGLATALIGILRAQTALCLVWREWLIKTFNVGSTRLPTPQALIVC